MLEIIIALAAAIFLGNTLAHRIRVTPAILLIFFGLALALLPAMHELREVGLPSYVILEIFLPIMLFWEARNTSLREVRKSLRAIITSGTVLVIVTAFAMAGVLTHFFHIDWGTALIISAALAPTDATAVATLNGKLPKRSITVLKAESLINDGTTLVVFALAIQVAGGTDLSVSHAGGMLAFSFLCGIVVGLAVGWVANRLRARIANPMNFVIYMMTIPFVEVSLVFWTGVFLSSGRNYYNREGNRPKGRVFMGKLTLLQRQQAVELFEQGYGYVLVSRMLELKQSQVELLSRMWRIHGRLCLMRRKNQQYSFETKKEVVTRYLQGDNPIELAKQYNISSDRLIRIWVKKWKTSGDVALRPRLTGYPPVQDTGTPLTEVEKLKRDNYYLQMQVDVLKKLKALRETPPSGN